MSQQVNDELTTRAAHFGLILDDISIVSSFTKFGHFVVHDDALDFDVSDSYCSFYICFQLNLT